MSKTWSDDDIADFFIWLLKKDVSEIPDKLLAKGKSNRAIANVLISLWKTDRRKINGH